MKKHTKSFTAQSCNAMVGDANLAVRGEISRFIISSRAACSGTTSKRISSLFVRNVTARFISGFSNDQRQLVVTGPALLFPGAMKRTRVYVNYSR